MNNKNKKPDFGVIAGALEGLNNYLFNFTQSADEGSKHSREIFNFAKQALLSNTDDITRYAMPRGISNKLFQIKHSFFQLRF
jgi:hypothetical protein